MTMRWMVLFLSIWSTAAFLPFSQAAPQLDPSLYAEMKWRMIGPFRGGRTMAGVGVPSQPNVFYIGHANGGVWKSTDYGHTWKPIFDGQPTGSIGAIAVADPDPNIIYVASGESVQRPDLAVGNGVYKSTDGGTTWRHLGLADTQQIAQIIVDPRDPNRVFVAAIGHPYGPNAERGVFRSTDGGATWQKVLYKDENTGASDVIFDPSNPQIVYAGLWPARRAPWTHGGAPYRMPGGGLFKSTDGGTTWRQLRNGLPSDADVTARITLAIAPSNPNRVFARVDARTNAGIYRSDDAGATFQLINSDRRIIGRSDDLFGVTVDPKDENTVYFANVVSHKSTDGGRTTTPLKGAPGGDDYIRIWINPNNTDIILMVSDQGAVVSVNRGQTWSTWYNQPTAQFYHVITDNRFPYWVYGGQQESGSAAVASRSDYGAISFRDWHTVGVEEYGYVAPDPLNPDIVYGGKVSKYTRGTADVQNVSPAAIRSAETRFNRTAPIVFSRADPKMLLFASQYLYKTTNGGESWETISPDLTREDPGVPPNFGGFVADDPQGGKRRGVIYTIGPSPLDANLIWAGTDDGLIHVTRDGGRTWSNVTPPDLTPWSKVSIVEASHFDPNTAYAAVNRFRLDDLRPHIYRTRDGGRTWQRITAGLPNDAPVNTVKQDHERRGLLFAGTEREVWLSFNDGDQWQPLQLNLPRTSIRDLVIHRDDLVAGTHGRSFWILDNITALRQITPATMQADVFLFKPQVAHRMRRSRNTDTPLPPETPLGQNPPDGAMIDYVLKTDAANPILLEILDARGKLVRRHSSNDPPEPLPPDLAIPSYWLRPPQKLNATAGMHRFVWDLRHTPPRGLNRSFPISAIPFDTPAGPLGPMAAPGMYTVRLTVEGRTYTQPVEIRMDPRVTTPQAGLTAKFTLEGEIYTAMNSAYDALQRIRGSRPEVERSLNQIYGQLNTILGILDNSDNAPTSQATAAARRLQQELEEVLARARN